MKISLNLPNLNFNTKQMKYYPNLRPLKCDTVSFSAMKKNQFSGIDLMIINRFKAPIEKFNSDEDFQTWCKNKVQNEYISKKDELSKSVDPQAQIQKGKILGDWIEYVTAENEAYTPAIQLMILSSITSLLSEDTNHLPPVLDKRILADTVYEITENCKKDKNYNPNFNKLYRNKLQAGIIKEKTNLDTSLSGWIMIPSKKNDHKNFEENVKKLQTLSHDNWCTKTYNAEPYLAEGDFHIYMEKGKPKLGVRFDGKEIAEIQGEKNNSKIPLNYLDIAKAHIKELNCPISSKTTEELTKAEKLKDKINKMYKKLSEQGLNLKTCSTKQLFDAFEIQYEENADGKLILEEYKQPDDNCSFSDLGINENRLFQDITEIKGDVDFENSNVTNLGSLEKIGGSADFRDLQINNTGILKEIGGNAWFCNSKITNLGCLTKIGGNAGFESSSITDLGSLKVIGGNADFRHSVLTTLGNLEKIGGLANFSYSKITDLGSLKSIGGNARFESSEITSLGQLETIGGNTDFEDSNLTDLGLLKAIGGDVRFRQSKITDLKNLETILGDAHFNYSEIISLGKLKTIGGSAYFEFSKITDLGRLETIGKSAVFHCSRVRNLGELKSIGGSAFFGESDIQSLAKLEVIKKDANFERSQVSDLGNLETIGGNVYFGKNSKVTSLGKLKSVHGKNIGDIKNPQELEYF